jgi:hypothetical protein
MAETKTTEETHWIIGKPAFFVFAALIFLGFITFILQAAGDHPERAWQAYLINFLMWSAIAQGGLLFSMVTHITRARWSGPLQGLSESFAAFFPVSFILFLILFIGSDHLFTWLHEDLHGKEVWLNLPFLFTRDFIGLLILYGLGFAYLYDSLRIKMAGATPRGKWHSFLQKRWARSKKEKAVYQDRMRVTGVLYILFYALVLSLLAFDLVMSMDPHWISTLFGAYAFVKAFYIGLGSLIILASLVRMKYGDEAGLTTSHFHDLGKLFFGFCLLWADFFYCQFVVIWYGNIPEETSYIIQRTMLSPWNSLAWTVFVMVFIIPFFILINRKIKTKPAFMVVLCSFVLLGIWLEHLLLLGPALNHNAARIPVGLGDGLISLGFLGLMVLAVTYFFNHFPRLLKEEGGGTV